MQVSEERLDGVAERLERRTMMAGVAATLVLGIAVMFVNLWVGIAIAIICPPAWAIYIRTMVDAAPARLTAAVGAREPAASEYPRLQNLLDGLGGTTGVSEVGVRVFDSDSMNAAVLTGRDGSEIVLTTALAEGLDRLELEAVLSNLLGRIRDGSARYCTVLLGLPGSSRAEERVRARLGDQHQVLSDLAAVAVTRYPPALSSALETMAAAGTAVDSAPPSTSPLWLVPPHRDGGPDTPSIALRVAVLDEL